MTLNCLEKELWLLLIGIPNTHKLRIPRKKDNDRKSNMLADKNNDRN